MKTPKHITLEKSQNNEYRNILIRSCGHLRITITNNGEGIFYSLCSAGYASVNDTVLMLAASISKNFDKYFNSIQ